MLTLAQESLLAELFSICGRMDLFDDISESAPLILEFTEIFTKNALLKDLNDELAQDELNDLADLNLILTNISKTLWPACEDILDYVKKCDVKNDAIINRLNWLKSRELTANNLAIQHCMISKIFTIMLMDGSADYKGLIRKHATIDETNSLKPIKLFIDLDILTNELHNLSRTNKIKPWFSLNQLKCFSIIYHPKEYAAHKKSFGLEAPVNQMQMDIRSMALDRAINPVENPAFRENGFNPKKYKIHMERLCYYVKQKWVNIETHRIIKETSMVKIYAYVYNPVTAELMIDEDEPIKYQVNENPAKLLKKITLLKNKKMSYLDIYNSFLRDPDDRIAKELGRKDVRQVESIIRQVNERLPDSRPKFIVDQKDSNNLNNKTALISSSYQSSKS